MQQATINPEEDIRIVADEPFYTTSGAIKMMGIGKTCLTNEIKEGNITVFCHPNGNLFSKEAILAWILKRTIKAKR